MILFKSVKCHPFQTQDEDTVMLNLTQLYCDQFKARVDVGSFVMVLDREADNSVLIGQILTVHPNCNGDSVSTAINPRFSLNVYKKLASVRLLKNRQEPIREGPACDLVVLIESTDTIVVEAKDIVDICFVFHPDDPHLSNSISVYGSQNVFACRSRYDDVNNLLVCKTRSACNPFKTSTLAYESFHFQVWSAILRLREAFFQCLNRNSIKQGTKQTVKTHLSKVVWMYIKRTLRCFLKEVCIGKEDEIPSCSVLPCRIFISRKKRTSMTPVFASHSKSVPRESHLVRLQTEDQLNALRYLLGSYVTCGVRRGRPKKDCSHRLRENDSINYVEPCEDPLPEDGSLPTICYDNGIDFKWHDDGNLMICVRYSNCLYTTMRDGTFSFLPNIDKFHRDLFGSNSPALLASIAADNEDCDSQDSLQGVFNEDTIRVGRCFQWTDRFLYKVSEIIVDTMSVKIQCIDQSASVEQHGKVVVLTAIDDLEELIRSIEQYYDSGSSESDE